jgi:uncharacterized membrane protein YphA (DoxX/SURF4 family)
LRSPGCSAAGRITAKLKDGRLYLMQRKNKMSDYWNMGTAIGLCAAIGIVLGALLYNLVLWLCIGAGIGVVLGAVTQMYKKKK